MTPRRKTTRTSARPLTEKETAELTRIDAIATSEDPSELRAALPGARPNPIVDVVDFVGRTARNLKEIEEMVRPLLENASSPSSRSSLERLLRQTIRQRFELYDACGMTRISDQRDS